jgi:hypothetical protein
MKTFASSTRIVGVGLTAVALTVVMVGCGGMNSSSTASNANSLAGKLSMSVYDGGSIVYTDSTASSQGNSLSLVAGKTYSIRLSQANLVLGTTFELQAKQTNIPNGASFTLPLQIGTTTFTPSGTGDYSYKVVATLPSGAIASASYIAAVSCSTTPLSLSSLNANAISVSPGSATNLFNLSASGLTAGANGSGPYLCAWDPTGTGIIDTTFKSCDTALSNFYSNFVGSRKVSIIVKDSCGTTTTVSKVLNFAATVPPMPGNVFISGAVTNAGASSSSSGTVAGDLRVDGVNYLATNAGGYNIVQPSYNSGKFQIYAALNYGMASSVQFGIQIKIKGITDNLNPAAQTGSVDVSNAVIESVTYTTDQAGDSSATISLTGNQAICVLSNQGSQVHSVSGAPCTSGQSGTNKGVTVEVYGHYKCTGMTSASGAKMTLEGNFDGYTNLVDNCNGGGGGGGGIVPVTL